MITTGGFLWSLKVQYQIHQWLLSTSKLLFMISLWAKLNKSDHTSAELILLNLFFQEP